MSLRILTTKITTKALNLMCEYIETAAKATKNAYRSGLIKNKCKLWFSRLSIKEFKIQY